MLRGIDEWAASDELAEVVAASARPVSSLGAARLDDLVVASAAWDARGGWERDQAAVAVVPEVVARLVMKAGPAIGLADRSIPRAGRYDAVLMTGGMVRAEIVKPRFVRELLEQSVTAGEVTFLGAHRDFSADENRLARALGMASSNEVDAMTEGMERTFGPLGAPQVGRHGPGDGTGWQSLSWPGGGTSFGVLAAPSSDPIRRRANTADTFRFWADGSWADGKWADRDQAERSEIRSVLVVTTPIYVPYQAAVAVQVLGLERGMAVETIGVTEAASDLGDHTQPFLPQHHLQELRSALLAMHSLRAALAERLAHL